jgi:hypothetical protein
MRHPISATLPANADSIAGVLDHGFELYARSFSRTWGFIALSCLPNALVGVVIGEVQASFGNMLAGGAFGTMVMKFWWFFPLWLLNSWFSLSLYNALYYRTGLIARGLDESWWRCFKRGFSLGLQSLGLTLISLMLIFAATMIAAIWVGVSGVILGAAMVAGGEFNAFISVFLMLIILLPPIMVFSFVLVPILLAPCALVLRNEGVFGALGTGFRLIGQHFWRATIVLTVPGVIYSVAYGGVFGVLTATTLLGGYVNVESTLFNVLLQLVSIPLMALLMPLFVASIVALFSDLLLRRDGQDLKQQLKALS